MKRLTALMLFLGSVMLSACGDKEARDYAEKLIPVLDSYQEQLSQKIKAEQEFYSELADNFEQARQDDIKTRLEKERAVRSQDLGEQFARSNTPPSLSRILEEVQKYADEDFKTTKALLQEGLDTRSKHLADLESLELEVQKVKLLKQSLNELSKGKSGFKKFKEATEFILQTEAEINKLLCIDLKKNLATLEAEKAKTSEPAAKKALDSRIASLKQRIATKKCP
jgi:hypothetical protein